MGGPPAEEPGGGPPAEGPVGGASRRGATAAAAVGPGGAPAEEPGEGGEGGKPQKTLQSPSRQNEAPTDNTKRQQTIRSTGIFDKDMTN